VTSSSLFFGLALGVALVAGGSVAAFAAANALKKIAAVLTALVGAGLVLALMGAPSVALFAFVAIAFAYCILGVAIAVRLQEAYGSAELSELDAADEQDEPRESGT
jgi:hypothetical protein